MPLIICNLQYLCCFIVFDSIMKTALLSIFITSFYLFCNAQIDSTYIQPFDEKIAVRTFLMKKFIIMAHESDAEGVEESFVPNNPINIGVGLSVKNTVIDFWYGYGFNFMRDKKRGKTQSLDFQLHNYGRKFVFDIFLQQYKGFYNESNKMIHPDLQIHKYGVSGQYVFNNERYSYKAVYNQSEKQVKSAGSFLAGTGLFYTKIKTKETNIVEIGNYFNNLQLGLSGGYTYTWVIDKKWYLNGFITAGGNLGFERKGSSERRRLTISPTTLPRVSYGYNADRWSVNMSFVSNLLFPTLTEESEVNLVSGNASISFIYRFNTLKPFF